MRAGLQPPDPQYLLLRLKTLWFKPVNQSGGGAPTWLRRDLAGRRKILLRNVTTGKGFFNIFCCHPPGFCAIKEKLQP
jgi:hypothetical protein